MLSGSPCLVPFDVGAHCRSLSVVKRCEHLYAGFLHASLSQGPPYAAVLNCVACLFEVNLVPIGNLLSELLKRVQVVRPGVTWCDGQRSGWRLAWVVEAEEPVQMGIKQRSAVAL